MTNPVTRKHKVELADYPHHRDIVNRLLLSQFQEFEIAVLEEIVNGSIKISLNQLADSLETTVDSLMPLIQRLEEVELLKLEQGLLLINKEMRKYYSCELAKFNHSFEPDLQHLQALLQKVPIHILPLWYAIPRTSDNIFQSILEKYFLTPRVYQKHLDDLAVDNVLLYKLFEALNQKKDFILPASVIMEMFNISHSEFQELVLLFEYHFGGCLCYRRIGNVWCEHVTLYHEWQQYQGFLRGNAPTTIPDDENVIRKHPSDFGFVEDLILFLQTVTKNPSLVTDHQDPRWSAIYAHIQIEHLADYLAQLSRVAVYLQFITLKGGDCTLHTEEIKAWLVKNKQDQASDIYCLMLTYVRQGWEEARGCSERDFREVEKALKRIAHSGWIYFDEFSKGVTAAIGRHHPVTLQQKGKKWRYSLPEYNEDERQLLFCIIFKHFSATCLVATGHLQGKPCFCVTPYGRMSLGD